MVMDYKTIALQSPSANTPINIIVGSLTIKTYYRNRILTIFDYGQNYTAGVTCSAAKFYKLTSSNGVDSISSNVKFYVALDNGRMIDMSIMLSFVFNFTDQAYAFTPSVSYT